MRRLFPGIALAALIFAGSLSAGGHDYINNGPFGWLSPGMATGCFGERYPILQLNMPEGAGYGNEVGGYGNSWTAPPGWDKGGVKPGKKGMEMPGKKGLQKPDAKEIEKRDGEELELPGLHQLMSRNRDGSSRKADREAAISGKLGRVAGTKLDLRGLSAKDAERLFWQGCRYYWQGETEEALAHVEAATELFENDARFWYYRSLAEAALGQDRRAGASLKQAVDLHLRGLPAASSISQALERVQGEPRMQLRQALEQARAGR